MYGKSLLGISRRVRRELEEEVGYIEMKGSSSDFHIAKVPPLALEESMASSGRYKSSR